MKKKLFALAVMGIYIAILVSGSLAYFTAEDQAVNVITIGSVDIAIYEYSKEGLIEQDKMPESFNNVEPGMRIKKEVQIHNEGKNSAWIRAKIVDGIFAADTEQELPKDILSYNIDESQWTLHDDGYYYYCGITQPGDSVTLFTLVTFDGPRMDNRYQGCETNIVVHAQAVQSEGNNTDNDVLKAAGWPEDVVIELGGAD